VSNENQQPDPIVVDVAIAYIQRDLSVSEGEPLRDLTQPAEFIPGAALLIKARASASADIVDLTPRLLSIMLGDQAQIADEDANPLPIDIKDLENDYSGTRLLFAARGPQLEGMDETPTWNIYEYDISSDDMRRVIRSSTLAQAGDDTGPVYLADGRIVFSSTRQRGNQARLLDEGKPQYAGLEEGLDVPASVLHIMDSDGGNITQISFNQSHDLDPIVLPNGKILFSRWDQAGGNKGINLYQVNADGSDLTLMYGRHSHSSVTGLEDVQYANTRVTPQGQVLLGINSFSAPLFGTNYISIDIDGFIDNTRAIDSMQSLVGPAQQNVLFDSISLADEISPGGYITALYPLWDGSGRILFAWSQCLLYPPVPADGESSAERIIAPCSEENIANPDFEPAPPVYGLWMFDPGLADSAQDTQSTQLPLTTGQSLIAISEVVAMETRPFPANPDSTIDRSRQQLIDDGLGVLHIQSVYDLDGSDTSPFGIAATRDPLQTPASARPARFLRVVKSVSIPDEDVRDFSNSAFGRSRNQLMREIVGYTPIQPDGSVEVAVPANIPFSIAVVDANGKRISQRHNNWLQVMPAEQKNCLGCHTSNSEAPHGRIDAQPPSINTGAANTGVPFPNTHPALFADVGETMAQTLTRVRGLQSLLPDIAFEDIWTNPAQQVPAQAFTYAYADLQTALPVTPACAQNWTAICRSVINYPDNIAPLFDLPRITADELGNVLQDNTCTACHAPTDAQGALQVPLAQLDLSSSPSTDNPDLFTSYRELMFNDVEQDIVDGALLDKLEPVLDRNGNPVFLRDEEGELILDAEGNAIALTQTVGIRASMSTQGALASGTFFATFSGDSHQGWLSPAELRLIAEWLDIGGQYYNNPFDAPEE
jgi:hypothetical protein